MAQVALSKRIGRLFCETVLDAGYDVAVMEIITVFHNSSI
jgi:hypothetical protein